MKKMIELLVYVIMRDSLKVVYIRFMVILIQLKKMVIVQITLNAKSLKQKVFCLCSMTTTVLSE